MRYSDDPINDYNAYEADMCRAMCGDEEDDYPVCDICGEQINDDHYYNIDGTFLCEDCLNNEYRVEIC